MSSLEIAITRGAKELTQLLCSSSHIRELDFQDFLNFYLQALNLKDNHGIFMQIISNNVSLNESTELSILLSKLIRINNCKLLSRSA